jgi:glycosyltransferase involved in cell wall biosynthesis
LRNRKVLFAHDGPLEVGPDGVPRGVSYTPEMVARYLTLGSTVTFLMRQKKIEQEKAGGYTALTNNEFKFIAVPNMKGPLKILANYRNARNQIRRELSRHDVIVARLPSTVGRWAYYEARAQRKPVLIEFVACTWDALWNYSLLGKIAALYYFLLNKKLLKAAPYVMYVTETFLQGRYPTTGNWVACSDVIVKAGDAEVLQRRIPRIRDLNSQTSAMILATVAAVDVAYKDQATVLRALAALGPEAVRFVYRIIGQGDPRKLVELAKELGVQDRLEVVGPVPASEVCSWLDDTDIYIQPSRVEGLPRALIEAMSRGCPAIGTNVGGIPELLPPERVFKKSDYRALAELLKNFSNEEMLQAANRNFEHAKRYSQEVLESRRQAFYQQFLAKTLEQT